MVRCPICLRFMSTLHVITHAFLWSLMEVETEGKRGWMYDSQTECSGLLNLTWYHIVMNLIAMMTVTFIIRPNLTEKTPDEMKQTCVIWVYNLVVWFVVEDVGWFIVNGMTYRSAPWQNHTSSVLSTVLPLGFIWFMHKNNYHREFYWDWIMIPIILYIWLPLGTPFDSHEPHLPRHNYCR